MGRVQDRQIDNWFSMPSQPWRSYQGVGSRTHGTDKKTVIKKTAVFHIKWALFSCRECVYWQREFTLSLSPLSLEWEESLVSSLVWNISLPLLSLTWMSRVTGVTQTVSCKFYQSYCLILCSVYFREPDPKFSISSCGSSLIHPQDCNGMMNYELWTLTCPTHRCSSVHKSRTFCASASSETSSITVTTAKQLHTVYDQLATGPRG